ncbi:lysylphosphatidylglycerol synthase transmembrane domain-containing protein [Sporomusa sp. KB1]|jgi:uncharacterized membrane protein YbhN (UPF0104 family)|uniref:lysylphosphatidylglycerol synthase transmembrane domain-containing protein n=1 Tax=Sporomusa sp. KB1 TaxID=943346 RepID=UPI0021083112|nr:lysylphosphatidylglycerol synthase transmembrane domain-containing protein [Sporomusa sp. KB1]
MRDETSITIKSLQNKLIIGLVLGLIISTSLALWGDVGQIGNAVKGFGWHYAPQILAFVVMGYLGRFLKWQLYLEELDIKIGWQDSARVFFSGLCMAVTPGKVGEVLKSYLLLKQHKVSFCRSAPTVIAERLTDLIAMLILASLAANFVTYGQTVIVMGLLMSLGLICVLQWRRLATTLIKGLEHIPFVKPKAQLLNAMYESAYILSGGSLLFKALLISVIAWLCECIALYYILLGFGTAASLQVAMFVFSLGSIAGGLSMLPGGLGVAEGSMIGLLLSCGIDFTGAAGATLFARFGTLWFGVFLGLLTLLLNWRRFNLNARSD